MRGKHFNTEEPARGRCALVHGSWKRAGARIACAGACALMVGQMILPSVALATELTGGADAAGESAAAAQAAPTTEQTTPAQTGVTSTSPQQEPAASQGAGQGQPSQATSTGDAGAGAAGAGTSAATASSSVQNAAPGNASLVDRVATQGVTDVTGGSNTTVDTTVRNNYTDIRTDKTFDLTDGHAVAEGDFSSLDGTALSFAGLGDLPLRAVFDEAAGMTAFDVDVSGITRQQEERRYATELTEFKSLMKTTYEGSKLTYTGTTYEPGDVIVGNPDDAFGESGGKTIIHEIRDDYYTREHVYVQFNLIISAAETPAIVTAAVENAKLVYAPGEAPQATATVAAADADKYEIAYECWEEMEGSDPRNLEPVAFWYSDGGKYTPSMKKIDHFEEGKLYMYSVALRLKGDNTFGMDCDVTVNGRPMTLVSHTVDGLMLPSVAWMLCEQPIDQEQAIDLVEIDGATTVFKVGDKPVFTAGVSAASNSIFQCEFWLGGDGSDVNSVDFWDQKITNHIDAFKAGVTYRYGFYLKARRGFHFTRDTKVKINGVSYNYEWAATDAENLDRDGQTETMWVYTDLTFTPEAAPTPTPVGPEKPATDPGQQPADKGGDKKGDPAATPSVKTAAVKKGKDASGDAALVSTGDDAALTVAAMGVAGVTVAAIGVAATRRRS